MAEQLILKDEVYAVVGAAMEVYNELGCGFSEAIYQAALELELRARTIPFEPQKKLEVRYKQWVLPKHYFADFLCYSKLLVEVKALQQFCGQEEAQVLNYLKATGLEVAVLLYFGSYRKLQWKRLSRTRTGIYDAEEAIG